MNVPRRKQLGEILLIPILLVVVLFGTLLISTPIVIGAPSLTVKSPGWGMYNRSDIKVNLDITGTTKIWNVWDTRAGEKWVYVSNQTYTAPTNMVALPSGVNFVFNAWAIDGGVTIRKQITFHNDLNAFVAASGEATAIQTAIDACQAAGSQGNVTIPKGTWNFTKGYNTITSPIVDIGEQVDLWGFPNNRSESTGMVVEPWNTQLEMLKPYESVYGSIKIWIRWLLNNDNEAPVRMSDIMLNGYRSVDNNDENIWVAVQFRDCKVARFDHCKVLNLGSSVGPHVGGAPCSWTRIFIVDHSNFTVTHGHVESNAPSCTTLSGIGAGYSNGNGPWTNNTDNLMGQQTNQTLIFEDNYLSGFRHVVSSSNGPWYVLRYSTVKRDSGYGEVDVHNTGQGSEVYNCLFEEPNQARFDRAGSWADVVWQRGGDLIVVDNECNDHTNFVVLTVALAAEKYKKLAHAWIWDNTGDTTNVDPRVDITINVDYWLEEKPGYRKYIYPHPMVTDYYNPSFPPTWNIHGGIGKQEEHHTGGDTAFNVTIEQGYNTTLGNDKCRLSIEWFGDMFGSTLSGNHIIQENSTGSFVNHTVAFTGNHKEWGNKTITLPSTGTVWFRAFAGSGNTLAATPWQFIVTEESESGFSGILNTIINALIGNINTVSKINIVEVNNVP